MKTKLLILILFGQIFISAGQSIQINQIIPSAVSGGINVNLMVTTYNGAGYLSHSYTVMGNTINLSVCYWFNITLPVYQINNNFFISVPNDINYIINISIFNSSSQTTCNNYAMGPTASTNYLNIENFAEANNKYLIYPNPSAGIIEIKGDNFLAKQIDIYDNFARLVKQFKATSTKNIDLSDLNNGVYYMKIETENGNSTQKLILKK